MEKTKGRKGTEDQSGYKRPEEQEHKGPQEQWVQKEKQWVETMGREDKRNKEHRGSEEKWVLNA